MPATSPQTLVGAILGAIHESGYSAILISAVREHPRKFVVSTPDGSCLVTWIYAWTLTHGGRPSLPDEYRIQMTSVQSPLQLNPTGTTLLLGYEPNLQMFAGFDIERHSHFTTGSPSVQIDIHTLLKALQDGLAFDKKTNNEIAIGIRPDQLVAYALNAQKFHQYGRGNHILKLFQRASSLETITPEEIAPLAEERRRVIQTVSRLSRKANFCKQVLNAYGNRCAVTGIQLKLVDAAHILPVGAPESSDDIRNGIALSPTYHRAFDAGLLFLNENLEMQINERKAATLAELNLTGGLEELMSKARRVLLPQDRRQWPNVALVRKANKFRQIT